MQKLRVPRYLQWLLWVGMSFLLLMSALRLLFFFCFPHSIVLSQATPSFILGIRYDLRIVSIVTLLIFLLSILGLDPYNKKAGKATAITLVTVFSFLFMLLYIFDFAFYSYLGQRLSGSILNYAEDAAISMSMVWQTYPVLWLTLALVVGTLALRLISTRLYRKIQQQPSLTTKPSRIGWGITFFLLLAIGIFGRVGQYPLRWSDAFGLGSDYKSQLAFNPFQSFFSSLSFRHSTYDKEKVKEHYDLMASFLGVTNPDAEKLNYDRVVKPTVKPGFVPPNVVLVICESFSAYKSSMVNDRLNTTPFFKSMANSGIYFDRCFSPTYGTAKGVWAIITGTPEVQLTSTASRNPAAVDQHTIINDFKGYEKYYFLGGSTSWANIRGLLNNNIENLHLYEEGDYKAAKIDVWGISDKNLFLESNKVLAKEKKPFFAIIQTADNHRPYTIPQEDAGAFRKLELPADTLHKYGFGSNEELNAFRYTDFTFEQFIKAASKESYFHNTIFVFIGDHGIFGGAEELLPKTFTDMRLTSEHIPLLFYSPSLIPAARYSYPVSQIDVLPTIAGLAHIPYVNTSLGRDVLQPGADRKAGAYIIDIDTKSNGYIQDGVFFSRGFSGVPEKMGNLNDNSPLSLSDSARNYYRSMTEAFFETSRYLLLNNKKRVK